MRQDHRFTDTYRLMKSKERALRLLNDASISAGLGRYVNNIVHNAELSRQSGKPWRNVDYARFGRIHQCQKRLFILSDIERHYSY